VQTEQEHKRNIAEQEVQEVEGVLKMREVEKIQEVQKMWEVQRQVRKLEGR
jgi:hypothetical protein